MALHLTPGSLSEVLVPVPAGSESVGDHRQVTILRSLNFLIYLTKNGVNTHSVGLWLELNKYM